ncbi:zinc metalloproteinase nas-7-like [Scaptodrosophila lebanonensis]|uniref:Metalloendopeptidase n=1 Tax=Drosophila lebanonensis TaxID=7225 RepID=A0A6J2TSD6_DROLE|nr:zinc metalloproteinase nas-7-like [Scaptodrosophila lebanonensis]
MLFTCALVFVLPGYIFGQYLPLLDTDYEQSAEYNAYSAFQGPDSNLMQDFYQNNKLDKSADIAGESHSNEEFDEADSTIVLGPDIFLKSYKYQIWEEPDPDLVRYHDMTGKESPKVCDEKKPIYCSKRDFVEGAHKPVAYNPHEQRLPWPSTTIYYKFHKNVSKEKEKRVKDDLRMFEQKTCLKFIPLPNRTEIKDYILFREEDDCFSRVGYKERPHNAYIRHDYCNTAFIIIHVLNFDHIHNDIYRDEYIDYKKENCKQSQNYKKQNTSNFDIRYDYLSPLHYSNCAAAKGDDPVFTFTFCPSIELERESQKVPVTEWDYFKINRMYCDKWYYNNKKSN